MRLVALIPEDGFAILRDGTQLLFTRPPFLSFDSIGESALENALTRYGYDAIDAPEESRSEAIARIQRVMASRPAPGNAELLERLRKVRP
jgi:hypothetical protein